MASLATSISRACQGLQETAPAYESYAAKRMRKARVGFIRKALGLVAAQLLVTTAACCSAMFIPSLRSYFISTWSTDGSSSHGVISFIIPFICLGCTWAFQHRHPLNLLSLLLFTLSSSWGIARICVVLHEVGFGHVIGLAAGLTTVATAGISVFALLSKRDFSFWRAGLFTSLLTFCATGAVALTCEYAGWPYPYLLHHACGVVLFSLYLLYDVHVLATRMSMDDHIPAAIGIYLDIINLFLQLLKLILELADFRKTNK